MTDLHTLLADLDAESADLEARVAPLPEADWARPTPAAGWTIAHQIAHLAWTDNAAYLSTTDEAAFMEILAGAAEDPAHFVDRGAADYLAPPAELLERWRAGRAKLRDALLATPEGVKLPWFATRMSARSMATGRIMETWAHGLDVAEALGQQREPTARLRHVAFLGVHAMKYSFAAHGRATPTAPVRVELVAPDQTIWGYGPEDAADRVVGPALDFCLLVTQRRRPDELAVKATGPAATEWLDVAQAFAGPPGAKR